MYTFNKVLKHITTHAACFMNKEYDTRQIRNKSSLCWKKHARKDFNQSEYNMYISYLLKIYYGDVSIVIYE